MICVPGTIQEVCIRIVSVAAAAASLVGCSRTAEPPAMTNDATLAASPQQSEMAEVVISASRAPSRPQG